MSAGFKNDDCYFYYNSICAKGPNCQFRHEPAAKAAKTVCFYWQTSICTRLNCGFRHGEVGEPTVVDRSTQQCFWEFQPSGCQKPQCPFKHVNPKTKQIESGSLIVNKEKLQSLQNILPVDCTTIHSVADKPKRLVIPPGTGGIARRAVTGGIKNRLGAQGNVRKRLGVKLGDGEEKAISQPIGAGVTEKPIEIEEEKPSIEEIALRESAIKSIDLRNRLDAKLSVQAQEAEVRTVRLVEKSSKRDKNDNERGSRSLKRKSKVKDGKKLKRKADKNSDELDEHQRRRNPHSETDLPSASDYSDLDTPLGSPDPDLITVMSKTTGMYADTKTFSKSAKIRLGKRKVTLSRENSPDIQILETRTVSRKEGNVTKAMPRTRPNKEPADPIEILHKLDDRKEYARSAAGSVSPPHKRSLLVRSESPAATASSPKRVIRARCETTSGQTRDVSPSAARASRSNSRSPSPPPVKDKDASVPKDKTSPKKPKKAKSKKLKKVKKDKSEKKKVRKGSKSKMKKKRSKGDSDAEDQSDPDFNPDIQDKEVGVEEGGSIPVDDDDIIEKLDEMINGC